VGGQNVFFVSSDVVAGREVDAHNEHLSTVRCLRFAHSQLSTGFPHHLTEVTRPCRSPNTTKLCCNKLLVHGTWTWGVVLTSKSTCKASYTTARSYKHVGRPTCTMFSLAIQIHKNTEEVRAILFFWVRFFTWPSLGGRIKRCTPFVCLSVRPSVSPFRACDFLETGKP